jgi:hypothetical protein
MMIAQALVDDIMAEADQTTIAVELQAVGDRTVYLHFLGATAPGVGHGRAVMRDILEMADRLGVKILCMPIADCVSAWNIDPSGGVIGVQF